MFTYLITLQWAKYLLCAFKPEFILSLLSLVTSANVSLLHISVTLSTDGELVLALQFLLHKSVFPKYVLKLVAYVSFLDWIFENPEEDKSQCAYPSSHCRHGRPAEHYEESGLAGQGSQGLRC